jgi:hypothetical protein
MTHADLEILKSRLEDACKLIHELRQFKLPGEVNLTTAMIQILIEGSLHTVEGSFPRPEDVA